MEARLRREGGKRVGRRDKRDGVEDGRMMMKKKMMMRRRKGLKIK